MFRHFLGLFGVLFVSVVPEIAAQGFGRKKHHPFNKEGSATFQNANEKAKRMGLGMEETHDNFDMSTVMAEMEPTEIEGLCEIVQQVDTMGKAIIKNQLETLGRLASMTPQEVEKEIERDMEVWTGDGALEKLLSNPDDFIMNVEKTGIVPQHELARLKSDPEFYEQVVKEAYYTMNLVWSNPDKVIEAKAGVHQNVKLYRSGVLQSLMEMELYDNDEAVEVLRLGLLGNPQQYNLPGYPNPFVLPAIRRVLLNPKKFQAMVKKALTECDKEMIMGY